MQFDQFTVALLIARADAPVFDDAEAAAIQDAHMTYIVSLHDAGQVLSAGPLGGEDFRGLRVLRVEPEEARIFLDADPAVRAGRLSFRILTWHVPAGAMSFSPTRFPRSMADVTGA